MRKLLFIVLSFLSINSISQNITEIDSIEQELLATKSDTQKIKLLVSAANYYLHSNPKKCLRYNRQALEISKKLNIKPAILTTSMNVGYFLHKNGQTKEALELFNESMEIAKSLNNQNEIAQIHNNIAYILDALGNTKNAEKHYRESLVIRKRLKDTLGIAECLNNIGTIYEMRKNMPDSARIYFQEALKHLNGLNLDKVDKQLVNMITGTKASMLQNIASNYYKKGDYLNALEKYFASRKAQESINYIEGIVRTTKSIGDVYKAMGNTKKAIQMYEQCLEGANQTGYIDLKQIIVEALAKIHAEAGDYKKAFLYHVKNAELKDSILNEKSQEQMAKMEAKYESEKKQLEIDKLKNQKAAKDAKITAQEIQAKRQQLQKVAFASGFVLMLILAFVVFRSYKRKQKDNELIKKQKQNVETQKSLLEEKNQEITDSINYARRIQDAILPPEKVVKKTFKQSFILYKPKDIVSGDFYWLEVVEDHVLFAAADCTGHGVPGAMVSVVCYNALNRSVREFGLCSPGKILSKTRELVVENFKANDNEVKDGMDIALCSLTLNVSGSKLGEQPEIKAAALLQYAGANSPLWVIRKGGAEVEETKADKQPIGKYDKEEPFTTHSIELQQGDTLYIFSDGYPDQFGGPKGKKYKTGALKNFLLSIKDKDMTTQRQLLNEEFKNWKGELDQIDDVCVIGVRV